MKKEMTIWGIGGKLFLYTVIFSVVIASINRYYLPQWRFTLLSEKSAVLIGGVFILVGLVILVISIHTISCKFRAGKLSTTGIYSITRNPIYSAWIVFIMPGAVIISRYVLWWLIPIFMYIVFKILIKKEDTYLEERFGEEYRAYRSRVNELIPRIW